MSTKEERYQIGADILQLMAANDDLPLPNINRVGKVMMEYFKSESYADGLTGHWHKKLTKDYWVRHITEISAELRKQHLYFIFVRDMGKVTGVWKFATKQEYEQTLRRDYADIGTRHETYNEKVNDGKEKWKLELPNLAKVPLLTN